MSETVKDCHFPWTWMVVVADGDVKPCCYSAASIGNLHEASAEEVWNGPVAIELRRYIKADKIHPVCAGAACKFVQNTEDRRRPSVIPIHVAAS
jgi:radical SAM protein with 4Fe4S-binding SPASM domain